LDKSSKEDLSLFKMKFSKINRCPRCRLPQKGTHKCQYCDYDLSKNPIKTIRNKFEHIIGALSKEHLLAAKKLKMKDHGGTRSGTDRRKYKYMTWHFPEKRSGNDRRKRVDRRGQVARKKL
jgi:hypothetical protein